MACDELGLLFRGGGEAELRLERALPRARDGGLGLCLLERGLDRVDLGGQRRAEHGELLLRRSLGCRALLGPGVGRVGVPLREPVALGGLLQQLFPQRVGRLARRGELRLGGAQLGPRLGAGALGLGQGARRHGLRLHRAVGLRRRRRRQRAGVVGLGARRCGRGVGLSTSGGLGGGGGVRGLGRGGRHGGKPHGLLLRRRRGHTLGGALGGRRLERRDLLLEPRDLSLELVDREARLGLGLRVRREQRDLRLQGLDVRLVGLDGLGRLIVRLGRVLLRRKRARLSGSDRALRHARARLGRRLLRAHLVERLGGGGRQRPRLRLERAELLLARRQLLAQPLQLGLVGGALLGAGLGLGLLELGRLALLRRGARQLLAQPLHVGAARARLRLLRRRRLGELGLELGDLLHVRLEVGLALLARRLQLGAEGLDLGRRRRRALVGRLVGRHCRRRLRRLDCHALEPRHRVGVGREHPRQLGALGLPAAKLAHRGVVPRAAGREQRAARGRGLVRRRRRGNLVLGAPVHQAQVALEPLHLGRLRLGRLARRRGLGERRVARRLDLAERGARHLRLLAQPAELLGLEPGVVGLLEQRLDVRAQLGLAAAGLLGLRLRLLRHLLRRLARLSRHRLRLRQLGAQRLLARLGRPRRVGRRRCLPLDLAAEDLVRDGCRLELLRERVGAQRRRVGRRDGGHHGRRRRRRRGRLLLRRLPLRRLPLRRGLLRRRRRLLRVAERLVARRLRQLHHLLGLVQLGERALELLRQQRLALGRSRRLLVRGGLLLRVRGCGRRRALELLELGLHALQALALGLVRSVQRGAVGPDLLKLLAVHGAVLLRVDQRRVHRLHLVGQVGAVLLQTLDRGPQLADHPLVLGLAVEGILLAPLALLALSRFLLGRHGLLDRLQRGGLRGRKVHLGGGGGGGGSGGLQRGCRRRRRELGGGERALQRGRELRLERRALRRPRAFVPQQAGPDRLAESALRAVLARREALVPSGRVRVERPESGARRRLGRGLRLGDDVLGDGKCGHGLDRGSGAAGRTLENSTGRKAGRLPLPPSVLSTARSPRSPFSPPCCLPRWGRGVFGAGWGRQPRKRSLGSDSISQPPPLIPHPECGYAVTTSHSYPPFLPSNPSLEELKLSTLVRWQRC